MTDEEIKDFIKYLQVYLMILKMTLIIIKNCFQTIFQKK